jgi:hypothetical protein
MPFWFLQNSLPKNENKIFEIAENYNATLAQINLAGCCIITICYYQFQALLNLNILIAAVIGFMGSCKPKEKMSS